MHRRSLRFAVVLGIVAIWYTVFAATPSVYLPIVAYEVLPTPTESPIATDTSQPTETPSPTITPQPSPTSETAGIWGTVVYRGQRLGDVTVELWLCSPTTECPTVATARADASGHYFFANPATLAPDTLYRVAFLNVAEEGNTPNPDRIGGRVGPALTVYTQGSLAAGGTIDITNVYLVRPAPGATVRIPATFEWTSRSVGSDYFAWDLRDIGDNRVCLQDPPATATSIVFGPAVAPQTDCDIFTNTSYFWGVWVVTNGLYRDGYGLSYYENRVVFSSASIAYAPNSSLDTVGKGGARHLRRQGFDRQRLIRR